MREWECGEEECGYEEKKSKVWKHREQSHLVRKNERK